MTTYGISVKFPKLEFDDYIEHEGRKVQLTHYDTDHKTPLFLQINGTAYCIGFKNAIEWLKTGILKNPEVKVKTSKAKLNDKQLIVKTWKAANDGTVFSIDYDGKDLEVWEFERLLFPDLPDISRSHLNLFCPWQKFVFTPINAKDETWDEARKHQFPTTFDVLHWNVAKHIVERIAIVREVLKNESR
jgi:hypothetical protein